MNKITIGCTSQQNVAHFLKEEFNVVSPYIFYKNGSIIKNFDIYLNMDGQLEDTRMMQMHQIPQFGHRRMGKYEQTLHFKKLKIETPDTYKVPLDIPGGGRFDSLYLILNEIPNDEKFILKALDGARGIGQCLVNKDEFYKLVDMCANENVKMDAIIEEFEIGAKDSFKNDGEKKFLREQINYDNFIIQRKVNLAAEWRFVYFHGQDPMIVRRSVEGTWQANTSVTGKGEVEIFNLENKEHKEMQFIAYRLAKDLHAPFLSIDFYLDKDTNKIGCFEQQMQFGYAQMPKNELVESTIMAVNSYLQDHHKDL
jgi:hypothetical protein